jgi:hypothetical protein
VNLEQVLIAVFTLVGSLVGYAFKAKNDEHTRRLVVLETNQEAIRELIHAVTVSSAVAAAQNTAADTRLQKVENDISGMKSDLAAIREFMAKIEQVLRTQGPSL